jgi:starch synthase
MHVAFVASEAVPFAKTGGLADVAAALPRALEAQGQSVTLFLPCYRSAWSAGQPMTGTGVTLRVPVGEATVEGFVHQSTLPGSNVPVYLIDQPHYFDRDGIYGKNGSDYTDNCERFVFFNRAVLEAIRALQIPADLVHCNDWQTGLIPVYLKTLYQPVEGLGGLGSLLTIHNLAYLGLFWHWDMTLTGLDWRLFNWRQLEFHGRICFMKAGLVFADILSAVSPTYAKEIQTPQFGSGLDGLLRQRRADLRGIVNGIDTDAWCPSREPMIAERYDRSTVTQGKARGKAWLQQKAGLAERAEVPLFAQIGRLDPQKGWDLLAAVAHRLMQRDVQLVVLGEGSPKYHALLENLAVTYPGKFWAYLGFSDDLAHQIEAGADLFLMPSLFEPCGLNQLYSLAHGTVPIVRATGGLSDTVVDTNAETLADGRANGFAFRDADPEALWSAIERALAIWPDRKAWRKLIDNGMSADWSWRRSAAEYLELYKEVLRRARLRDGSAEQSEPSSRAPARLGTT